jgi:predicted porin
VADPFGAGYAGSIKNLFPSAGANTRVSNALVYSTPVVEGFSGDVLYALGEQAGSTTAGRQFGFGLNYAQGPLNARLVYNNKNNDTAAVGTTAAKLQDTGRNTMFAANYDFKVVKAFAYSADKGVNSAQIPVANAFGYAVAPKASLDSNDVLIGATIPAGNGSIMASYIRKNDKTANNQDADQWALGYLYSLSKRTQPTWRTPRSRTRTAPATPLVTTTKLVAATRPSTSACVTRSKRCPEAAAAAGS